MLQCDVAMLSLEIGSVNEAREFLCGRSIVGMI